MKTCFGISRSFWTLVVLIYSKVSGRPTHTNHAGLVILPMDASYLLFSQRAETMQKDELAIYRYRLKCVNNRLLGIIRSCVEFQA